MSPVATAELLSQLTAKLPESHGSDAAKGAKYEEVHGSAVAAGFVGAAATLAGAAGRADASVSNAVQQCTARLVQLLGNGDAPLAVAGAAALAHLQLASPLALEAGDITGLKVDAAAAPRTAAGTACTPACCVLHCCIAAAELLVIVVESTDRRSRSLVRMQT